MGGGAFPRIAAAPEVTRPGDLELKKSPLHQLSLEKQSSSFRFFRLHRHIYADFSRLIQAVLGELLENPNTSYPIFSILIHAR